jgi:hypothetical protein
VKNLIQKLGSSDNWIKVDTYKYLHKTGVYILIEIIPHQEIFKMSSYGQNGFEFKIRWEK